MEPLVCTHKQTRNNDDRLLLSKHCHCLSLCILSIVPFFCVSLCGCILCEDMHTKHSTHARNIATHDNNGTHKRRGEPPPPPPTSPKARSQSLIAREVSTNCVRFVRNNNTRTVHAPTRQHHFRGRRCDKAAREESCCCCCCCCLLLWLGYF